MYRSETVEVEGSAMQVLVFEPPGTGPHPGLVIAQHLPIAHTGLEKDPFQIRVGERYAEAGYACVIPYLFHWWPPETDVEVKRKEFSDPRTVADLAAARGLLAGLASVDDARIGILGHCFGGRVAWLGACHEPRYEACAVFYGGRIKLEFAGGEPAPITLAAGIRCPVLGIFGNDDQNPSAQDVDDYEAALEAAGVEHEFHRYDGAGHGFQDFNNPERYRETQSEDAWAKALDFFARHLR
ncbi:MAG: dienelactone hydrolase family protein [Gammaproteobacteria bacterium]|nr:dienelactone hydrolase family protein [Gammaproteobacteria bacterium]